MNFNFPKCKICIKLKLLVNIHLNVYDFIYLKYAYMSF